MEDHEIWIIDPESSPVVVSEDGSGTSVPLEVSGQDPALIQDPVQELPASNSTDETFTQEETENVTTKQPAEPQETSGEALLESEEIPEEPVQEPSTFTVTSPVVLAAAEPGDGPTVMVDVISSILGDYQRLSYTTEEYDSEGNLLSVSTEYVPGLAGLDYTWITGAVLFGLLIAGLLKLLGGLIRS